MEPFLRKCEWLIHELHGLLAEPRPEETPFDEDRFARVWWDGVMVLIWRYA